ncbi:hypothetical protein ACFLVP_04215 [Chloroflexota bacterium]
MRIGLIACSNGLGHIKRLIKIVNRLANYIPNAKLALYCEPWQVESLQGWGEYDLLCSGFSIQVIPFKIPVRWHANGNHYSEWLTNWHKDISEWNLSQYDYILSDNLVEPLLYNDRAILIGSFLWHDVLATAFSDNYQVQKYKAWAEEILGSIEPSMIVSRYFAMPATEQQTSTCGVGIVSFCRSNQNERRRVTPKHALMALGSTTGAERHLEPIVAAAHALNKASIKLFLSPQWHDTLSLHCVETELYDFNSNQLDTIDLAIIRAGIGTISDCITAKVPMIYMEEQNPEIKFNQRRLSEYAIGAPLQSILDEKPSLLNDPQIYCSMIDQMSAFSLQGEVEAASFIAGKWGL